MTVVAEQSKDRNQDVKKLGNRKRAKTVIVSLVVVENPVATNPVATNPVATNPVAANPVAAMVNELELERIKIGA